MVLVLVLLKLGYTMGRLGHSQMSGKRTRSLYILEGSIVTNEVRRPLSVTELKPTRLERRKLGHRREKCVI
ncbi:hypothetical protein Gotur_036125, partial [Gossypium turneri]